MTHSPAPPRRVLVADDEKNIRAMVKMCLEGSGYAVTQAGTADAALAALRRGSHDLALLDLRFGGVSGLDLLPQMLAIAPDMPVILFTAYATVDTAVEAIKRGAEDYLLKPFTPVELRRRVDQAIARRAHAAEGRTAPDIESANPRMRQCLGIIRRTAASDVPVLLKGESGTGKGMVARALHGWSARAARPFVVVNCPTLSEELLASELFGHAKGAFTGAVRDEAGRVEAAEGGTLFLDEITEIAPAMQAKLLRFLQEKAFERVGETRTRHADVRIVAATNRELDTEVAAGRFRRDLLYRLNVIEVELPPLRDRPEDIVGLARRFLAEASRRAGGPSLDFDETAERALLAYGWPGNVRELENAIQRAAVLAPGRVIGAELLPGAAAAPAPAVGVGDALTLDEIEREHIRRVVARTETLEDAARILGIDTSTLWRKRRRYDEAGGA